MSNSIHKKLEQVWIFENGRYLRQYWRIVAVEESDSSDHEIGLTAKAS